jgi:hypothetical protein
MVGVGGEIETIVGAVAVTVRYRLPLQPLHPALLYARMSQRYFTPFCRDPDVSRITPQDQGEWQKGNIEDWVMEGHRLARQESGGSGVGFWGLECCRRLDQVRARVRGYETIGLHSAVLPFNRAPSVMGLITLHSFPAFDI